MKVTQTQNCPSRVSAIARSHLASGAALACLVAWVLACDNNNPLKNGEPAPEPEPVWTTLGFEDHWVVRLELSSPYLYACAAYEGLFRLDLSQPHLEWQYMGLADTSLADEPFERVHWTGVQDVTVLDNGVILAGLFSGRADVCGVYRSLDGGTTWAPSDSAKPGVPVPYPPGVFSLEKSPCDPEVVLTGTEGAIYRSKDSGLSWDLVYGSAYVGLGWDDIRIPPADCNIAWAGGETSRMQERLAKSTDHGLTWERINLTELVPHDNAIFCIAVHPTDPAVVYLGMFWGVLKTTDGGDSWSFTTFFEDRMTAFNGLAIDEADPDHIFVARDCLVFESFDGAETANLLDADIGTAVTDLLYDSEPKALYVGTFEGVYRYGPP